MSMTQLIGYGDVLCNRASNARFMVIDPGGALGMPSVDGIPMSRGTRQPCGAVGEAPPDGEFRGGHRYRDPISGLTLLCIWPGRGVLCYGDRQMTPEPNGGHRSRVSVSQFGEEP